MVAVYENWRRPLVPISRGQDLCGLLNPYTRLGLVEEQPASLTPTVGVWHNTSGTWTTLAALGRLGLLMRSLGSQGSTPLSFLEAVLLPRACAVDGGILRY